MRVLITGAAGFIGSHLADRLLSQGHTVVGVDNLVTGREQNWSPHHQDPLYVVDVTDRPDFYAVANHARPNLVVHAAASYSDPDLWHRDIDTNIAGAVNVASVARHHKARVAYFQTVLPPVSSYAISKLAAEQYLRLAAIPLLVVRLANVYGPRNLSGPIPTFTRRLLSGETCTIAHTQRDFVYIDTLIHTLVERGWEPGDLVVHSGRNTHIRTVYELVSQALDVYGTFQDIGVPADDQPLFEFDGAQPVPDCSLAYGIAETVAWYQEHGVADTYTHLRVGA